MVSVLFQDCLTDMKHILMFTMLISFSQSSFANCSNKETIQFASKLAISKDFDEAQKGMDILLSLQSEAAKAALSKLSITGTAHHEIWSHYLEHYSQKPKNDNAGDKITYYNCSEIKKLMSVKVNR